MDNTWITPELLLILELHQDSYENASCDDSKKQVLDFIASELRASTGQQKKGFPRSLTKAISKWYKLQKGPEDTKDLEDERDEQLLGSKKWTKKWTVRKIAAHKEKGEIARLIGEKPGSIPYLQGYSNALTTVVQGKTKEKQIEYQELARSWNQEGPPREVQQRQAKNSLAATAMSAIKRIEKNFGAKAILYLATCNEKGQVNVASFEQNAFSSSSFRNQHPERQKKQLHCFSNWAGKALMEESDEEIEVEKKAIGIGRGKKRDLWPLSRNGNRNVLLPSSEDYGLEDKKSILRAFMTYTYRDFTRKPKSAVPWRKIEFSPSKWIHNWNDDILLGEPSKLKTPEVDNLYKYLLQRQSAGEGFSWVHKAEEDDTVAVVNRNGKGKEKEIEPEGVSTDDEGGPWGDSEEDDQIHYIQDGIDMERMEGSSGNSRMRDVERMAGISGNSRMGDMSIIEGSPGKSRKHGYEAPVQPPRKKMRLTVELPTTSMGENPTTTTRSSGRKRVPNKWKMQE